MSVINTMLLKLEARGAPAPSGDEAIDSAALPLPQIPVRPPRSVVGWRLPVLVVGGIALVGLAAFADWPRLMQAAPAAATVVPAPLVATATGSNPASPTPDATPAAPPVVAAPAPDLPTVAMAAPAPTVATPAPPTAVPAAAKARADAPAVANGDTATPAIASLAPPVAMPARIDKRPTPQSAGQQAQALYREAAAQAQAGQRHPALERAHAALAIDPRHAPSRQLAALLEHETGASGRAVQLLRQGLALAPGDQAQALLLARVLVTQGSHAEALSTLDQYGLAGAEADGLRGGILAQLGEFRRSLAAYEAAARQQPGNAMWWFGLAVALDSDGQAPRARLAYARAQAIGLPRDDLATYASQRIGALD